MHEERMYVARALLVVLGAAAVDDRFDAVRELALGVYRAPERQRVYHSGEEWKRAARGLHAAARTVVPDGAEAKALREGVVRYVCATCGAVSARQLGADVLDDLARRIRKKGQHAVAEGSRFGEAVRAHMRREQEEGALWMDSAWREAWRAMLVEIDASEVDARCVRWLVPVDVWEACRRSVGELESMTATLRAMEPEARRAHLEALYRQCPYPWAR